MQQVAQELDVIGVNDGGPLPATQCQSHQLGRLYKVRIVCEKAQLAHGKERRNCGHRFTSRFHSTLLKLIMFGNFDSLSLRVLVLLAVAIADAIPATFATLVETLISNFNRALEKKTYTLVELPLLLPKVPI